MNPYDVLGLPTSAALDVAKAAYRRLAQKHHPDRGGDEEKFKEVKAAFELIEAGWIPPPPPIPAGPPPRSSFSDDAPPKPIFRTEKAAPGYEARGRPPEYPTARRTGGPYSHREYAVELVISMQQANYGCNVPFRCDGKILTHWVQPGSREYSTKCTFPVEEVIGRGRVGDVYEVNVTLRIQG